MRLKITKQTALPEPVIWERQSNNQAQIKIKLGRFENRILEMAITEINTGCTIHRTADSMNLKMSEALLHDSVKEMENRLFLLEGKLLEEKPFKFYQIWSH